MYMRGWRVSYDGYPLKEKNTKFDEKMNSIIDKNVSDSISKVFFYGYQRLISCQNYISNTKYGCCIRY